MECKRCGDLLEPEETDFVKCCICRFKNKMSQRKRRGFATNQEDEGIDFKSISKHMIKLHTKILDKISSHRSYDRANNFFNETDFIDFEDIFMKLCRQEGKCLYCDTELKLINYKPYQANQMSIDRLDSNKGHTKNNTVICCYHCNTKKGKKTPKEYLKTLNYEKL